MLLLEALLLRWWGRAGSGQPHGKFSLHSSHPRVTRPGMPWAGPSKTCATLSKKLFQINLNSWAIQADFTKEKLNGHNSPEVRTDIYQSILRPEHTHSICPVHTSLRSILEIQS